MTTFVDYLFATGASRVEYVRSAKMQHNTPYDPAKDYYKKLREGIENLEKGKILTQDLNNIAANAHAKKQAHYKAMVDKYLAWRGNSVTGWVKPPSAIWMFQALSVTINPELGLDIQGVKYAIKLYMRKDPVPAKKLPIVLNLMTDGLKPNNNYTCALLDVRAGVLHSLAKPDPNILLLLQAEAASWNTIWPNV